MLSRNRSAGISTVVIVHLPSAARRDRDARQPLAPVGAKARGPDAPGRPSLGDQRKGGEKIRPPLVHWAFRPRAMFEGVPSPMYLAKISP